MARPDLPTHLLQQSLLTQYVFLTALMSQLVSITIFRMCGETCVNVSGALPSAGSRMSPNATHAARTLPHRPAPPNPLALHLHLAPGRRLAMGPTAPATSTTLTQVLSED